jgi:(p)ppGpp synthase/HD superfamily hydrolase
VDRDAIDGNTAVMGAGSANDAAQAFLVEAYRTRRRRPGRTAEHPIAVSQLLADDGQPAIVVVAGLLHDVLEDTDVTPGELRERFGQDVVRLVEALTHDATIAKYGERKAALRRQILDAGHEAAIVSLADKTAKLQSTRVRPKRRQMAHYAATLAGIEARYGHSRLSERLCEQLQRWPDR